jgi:hypothetical protein
MPLFFMVPALCFIDRLDLTCIVMAIWDIRMIGERDEKCCIWRLESYYNMMVSPDKSSFSGTLITLLE